MKVIGKKDNEWYFAPRKKEETDAAIEKISDLIQQDFSYIGITSATDLRINGYKETVEGLADKIDFSRYNLIIATINQDIT